MVIDSGARDGLIEVRYFELVDGKPRGTPELTISPKALDALTDRALEYRVAYALVEHAPGAESYPRAAIVIIGTLPCLIVMAIVPLAFFNGWMWLLALPLSIAVVPLGVLATAPLVLAQLERTHLKAIALTGDSESGVEMIRSGQLANCMPGMLKQWLRKADDRLVRQISSK